MGAGAGIGVESVVGAVGAGASGAVLSDITDGIAPLSAGAAEAGASELMDWGIGSLDGRGAGIAVSAGGELAMGSGTGLTSAMGAGVGSGAGAAGMGSAGGGANEGSAGAAGAGWLGAEASALIGMAPPASGAGIDALASVLGKLIL